MAFSLNKSHFKENAPQIIPNEKSKNNIINDSIFRRKKIQSIFLLVMTALIK